MAGTDSLASSRLGRLAQRTTGAVQAAQERCELCGAPIPAEHRHLLDLSRGEPLCACRPCSLLFDREAAGAGHLRLIPDRRARLTGFELDDVTWERLAIPVDIAFFFHSSRAQRVMAFYPGPMGATESLLGLEAWDELMSANPPLQTLEPDVEALLVNRARGARQYWIVPIDDCYELAGLIRSHWKGLTGGREVWEQLRRFFDALDSSARPLSSTEGKEA